MKKNLHTSPDMFDENIINVYNPGSKDNLLTNAGVMIIIIRD